jgi:hemerythrin
MEQLTDYARSHFAREEEMLEAADYADLADHKRQHGAFIEWLESVKRTYTMSPEAHGYISETVRDYLKNWLVKHILTTDMEYKDVLS